MSVDAAAGSITVTTRDGNTDVIYAADDTIVKRNRADATIADFQAGDRVRAHGERDDEGRFVAERILGGTPQS